MGSGESIRERLISCGLDGKMANAILHLADGIPRRASEVGRELGLSRMDAYGTLDRLKEKGLVTVTAERPMRFIGPSIKQALDILIGEQEAVLSRMRLHLDELESEGLHAMHADDELPSPPSFTVLRDRDTTMASLTTLLESAEERAWVLLGRYGILHIQRSPVLDALHAAASRGVDVRVMADIQNDTLRRFSALDESIAVRHVDETTLHGAFVDDEVGVFQLHVEANPTGRGRHDSALLVEAPAFLEAHAELIEHQWGNGVDLHVRRSRLTEGRILEPMRVSLGEGSFLERMKEGLDDLLGHGPSANAILRKSGAAVVSPLGHFGVDVGNVVRSIGVRVGEELALHLGDIEDDDAFRTHLQRTWTELGRGEILLEGTPPTRATVLDPHGCSGRPESHAVLCQLDEGVIAGLVQARYGVSVQPTVRTCATHASGGCGFSMTCETSASTGSSAQVDE
jgi:sugar-specific transcriptional regulator TrmB/predicted hydrocarbon binding protein